MQLKHLIEAFRTDAKDNVKPYIWDDALVTRWLNEAQEQAAVRARLLLEDTNDEVCRIDLQPGAKTYPLHESLYEIASVRLYASDTDSCPRLLPIVSREWLDHNVPGWRNTQSPVQWLIQGETTLRVVGSVQAGARLQLEGYRLPLCCMKHEHDQPEIHRASHMQLVHWALHKAFSQPDADGFDPTRSVAAETAFTHYFGHQPDSDLRRQTREDTPHTTMLMLP